MSEVRDAPYCFVLDEGRGDEVHAVVDVGSRWMELPHAAARSRGFVLLPGEELRTGEFEVDASHCVYLQAMRAAPEVSGDGLELELRFQDGDDDLPLAALHVGNEQDAAQPLARCLDLRAYAGRRGRLLLRCLPGAAGDPLGDWAAILAWCVATDDMLGLARARSQHAWRLANESGRFVDVYRDPVYGTQQASAEGASAARDVPVEAFGEAAMPQPRVVTGPFAVQAEPEPGETGFGYAVRLLALLDPPRIDFAERLRMLAANGRRPRLLSLCAGEARVEADLIARSGVACDLTLVDLSAELLRRAAARFPESVALRLAQGQVESFAAQDGGYDAVMFVSGLHHVVELEAVLARSAAALAPDGEFWLIGEQVGPVGNRLPSDARVVAQALFRALPERLRFNRLLGRVDEQLPDLDCASSSFEGIRSDEIPLVLSRYFAPIAEERRNCFLWRFIDLPYAANYDPGRGEDAATLRKLVAEEYAFYAGGGLGCELNAIYRGKLAARR